METIAEAGAKAGAKPKFSFAFRAQKPEFSPQAVSPSARRGLIFERNVKRQLEWHLVQGRYLLLEHNSWFTYGASENKDQICSPDFLLHFPDKIYIIEVKLTWTPEARQKLDQLYSPIVAKALGKPTSGFVLCRHLTPGAPKPVYTLSEIFMSPTQVLHWNPSTRLGW